MTGQNSQVAVFAGNLHLFGGVFHHHLFRSDDFELKSVGHVGRSSLVVGRWQNPQRYWPLPTPKDQRTTTILTLLSASERLRAPHRSCPSYKTPAQEYRRTSHH